MMNRKKFCFALLPLFTLILGCGGGNMPSTVAVTGTVTLDGNPVEGASVNFLSDAGSITASGKTDAGGKFTLKTVIGSQSVDGAILGRHKVAVVKTESDGQAITDPKEMMSKMAENPAITSDFKVKNIVPNKYSNPTQSGLTAEVTEGGANDFTFDLKSK